MDFKIQTLTPVNIGSGEVLSQFSDYVYEDGFVYYLDHDLMLKELLDKSNSEETIDKFVLIVKNRQKVTRRIDLS
jgi:CRISPR-associated protein Csm5